MPKLTETLESGQFCGVELNGQTPKMTYKEQQINKISEAIHQHYEHDSTTSIVQATKVLCFQKWPLQDTLRLTGLKMLQVFSLCLC